ncbi:hypothetical protein ACMBCN_02990, partial [Candidatus Liberibacter asiaticus]|nr:hypothetical protein [Candidatus Liberibacter asiaticus]
KIKDKIIIFLVYDLSFILKIFNKLQHIFQNNGNIIIKGKIGQNYSNLITKIVILLILFI